MSERRCNDCHRPRTFRPGGAVDRSHHVCLPSQQGGPVCRAVAGAIWPYRAQNDEQRKRLADVACERDAALERAVRAEAEAARLKAENDDFRLGGASIGMRAVLADMGDMHRAIVAYADARPAVGVQSPKRTAATHFALMELGKKLRGANP